MNQDQEQIDQEFWDNNLSESVRSFMAASYGLGANKKDHRKKIMELSNDELIEPILAMIEMQMPATYDGDEAREAIVQEWLADLVSDDRDRVLRAVGLRS